MEHTDFELIKHTLSGDQDAFTVLVRRYQKRVHALAWRKIGDFHIAEDITQETFLRAYRKLGSLKNPNLFAGWLYVIADRLCDTWFKRSRLKSQSLDALPKAELEENYYTEYTTKQREERASEKRVDLVKRLLKKLPESERIVITLHYLAGSSTKEISEFLGVSLNTVKSRLHRARKRLQKEDNMIRETLGSFQPSTTFTENIIRTLKESGAKIDPAAPVRSKPFLPWSIAIPSVILVVIMFGLGTQNLARFQQPYSLDSSTDMSVDIVNAAVVSNLPSDPDVINQIGNIKPPEDSKEPSQNSETKPSSTAYGRIVDVAGNPIDDVNLAILPVEYRNGRWRPIPVDEDSDLDDPLAFPAETNSDGNFIIPDFNHEAVLLATLPLHGPDSEVMKVKLDAISFYTSGDFGRGIVFATEPGQDIRNVEVTVQHFLQVNGQVLQVDGTPLSNERIKFDVRQLDLDVSGIAGLGLGSKTDADGNFVLYVKPHITGPAIFIMSVKFQEQIAMSKPFVYKPSDRTHKVVFNLNAQIMPNDQKNDQRSLITSTSVYSGVDAQGVWVVNPENGHAYKKIYCSNPDDAIAQAADEDAYLVTINNEVEQKWIDQVFSPFNVLIGLNDIEQEGKLQWQNGQPVDYTNWSKSKTKKIENGDEDYVILTLQGWKRLDRIAKNGDGFNPHSLKRKIDPII